MEDLKSWFPGSVSDDSCLSGSATFFPTSVFLGRKLWFKHGIPMSQEITSFLTKQLFSLMGSPEIDVPHIPAASLYCHLEELLLYQNSHRSLLFQEDNFVIKKSFVILRFGKQAYEGGKKFIWRDSNNS